MRKKIAVLAFAASALAGLSAPSFAFQSVKITTMTAGTRTGGALIADYTLKIRDTANPFGADRSSITWAGVSVPNTHWKIAEQLVLLNSTVTANGGGIQIYTDNTSLIDANPRFSDATPGDRSNADSMAAGLVHVIGSTTSETPLSVAWSIKDSSKTVELNDPVRGIGAADPNGGGTGYNNGFQWLFMKDKYNNVDIPSLNSLAFVNGQPFITMINVQGIHFGQDAGEFAATPDGTNTFVYLQANFTQAAAQENYQTSTMRVEAFLP